MADLPHSPPSPDDADAAPANPFMLGFGAVPTAWAGRHDILRLTDTSLRARTPTPQILLTGAKGTGKSVEPAAPTAVVLPAVSPDVIDLVFLFKVLGNVSSQGVLVCVDEAHDMTTKELEGPATTSPNQTSLERFPRWPHESVERCWPRRGTGCRDETARSSLR